MLSVAPSVQQFIWMKFEWFLNREIYIFTSIYDPFCTQTSLFSLTISLTFPNRKIISVPYLAITLYFRISLYSGSCILSDDIPHQILDFCVRVGTACDDCDWLNREGEKSSHHLPSFFLFVVHTFVVVVATASLTERKRGRGRLIREEKGDQWSFDILLFSFLPYFYLPSVSNCLFFLFESFLDLSFSLFSSILLLLPSFQPTVSLSSSSLHSSHLFAPSLIHSQSSLINSPLIILIPQE